MLRLVFKSCTVNQEEKRGRRECDAVRCGAVQCGICHMPNIVVFYCNGVRYQRSSRSKNMEGGIPGRDKSVRASL